MSVTSPPICKPQPAPAVQTADGALQPPSRVRAITRPLPTRAEKKKPACIVVRKARPQADAMRSTGTWSDAPSNALSAQKFRSVCVAFWISDRMSNWSGTLR